MATALHTMLRDPNTVQRRVMRDLILLSDANRGDGLKGAGFPA